MDECDVAPTDQRGELMLLFVSKGNKGSQVPFRTTRIQDNPVFEEDLTRD